MENIVFFLLAPVSMTGSWGKGGKVISEITTINPIYRCGKNPVLPQILISIHPRYLRMIESGEKVVEIRKRIPDECHLYHFFLAETGTGCVVGHFWKLFGEPPIRKVYPRNMTGQEILDTGISYNEILFYSAAKEIWFIPIGKYVRYGKPIPIERFCGLKRIPQNYVWIGDMNDGE